MASPSDSLSQLDDRLFLTDGGIETSLIFHDGLELPLFAAFVLLADEAGTAALRRYYGPYLTLAREAGTGFLFDEYSSHALAGTIDWALRNWRDQRGWRQLMQNGMHKDYSWDRQGPEYVALYRSLCGL